MAKHSVTIAGHRTSFSIEDPFWEALQEIAVSRGQSIAALIAEVDRARGSDLNLSAALRVRALQYFRERAGGADRG